MTVAGIVITDPDSMDAAADLLDTYAAALDRHGITEDYGRYLARMADELDAENGWTDDDDTSDCRVGIRRPVRQPDDDGWYLIVIVSRNTTPSRPHRRLRPSPSSPPIRQPAPRATATACIGWFPRTARSGKTLLDVQWQRHR